MTPKRVLIVGWDGATWEAIDPLLTKGRLPHLEGLLSRGFRADLRSTVPPVTPAAWTSMATGQAPGRTGVLGFRHLDLRRPSGFDPRLAGSADLRGRTLFEHAAGAGLGVALAAFPMTWPPFPIPGGVLLSGWPRPETADAPVWPPDEAAALGPWGDGPTRPSSTRFTRDGQEDPVAAAQQLDERTLRVAKHWLATRDDRLVFVGFQGTDHLAHRYWGRPELDDCYVRCDGWLGELQNAAGDDCAVFLVSDHGFGEGAAARVHLGRALADAGLLARAHASARRPSLAGRASRAVRHSLPSERWKRLRSHLPGAVRRWGFERALDASGLDSARTRVCRVSLYEGYEGIVVQVRGRQRGGIVAPEDWAGVRDEARAVLLGVTDDIGQVVRAIWNREDVWEGPALPGMPDLVVQLRDDLTGGNALDEGPVIEPISDLRSEGSHRRMGIVAGAGPGILRGTPEPIDPWDVLPTALALLGLGVPEGIDGVAVPAVLARPAPMPIPRAGLAAPQAIDDFEPEDLEQSLRELGYLS